MLLGGACGGKRARIGLTNEVLSRHSLFIGGTGCGKTQLMFHFVDQLRKRMTPDDVMIVFDSKGDYANAFFRSGDLILGNSRRYRDASARWNLFGEILADGTEDDVFWLNAQEIAGHCSHSECATRPTASFQTLRGMCLQACLFRS